MMAKYLIAGSFDDLTLEQQEYYWKLSRTNEVQYMDKNGEVWTVLDLTTDNDKDKNASVIVRTPRK